MKRYREIEKETIFIRLATKVERRSPINKKRAFNSFPDKEGYELVYMPYGEKGRGFYYKKLQV